jgi:hypothetical protein
VVAPKPKENTTKGKNYASELCTNVKPSLKNMIDRQGRAEENKAIHLKSDIKESKIYRHRIKSPRGLESLSRIILLTCNIS